MNKTKIEWCDSTWNPVTGCLHGCEYCYARRIAERFGTLFKGDTMPEDEGLTFLPDEPDRFYELDEPVRNDNGKLEPYPANFYPTFHRYRLDDPQHIKKPQTIFVCSMAALFGDWVPYSWIEEIFAACEKAPQHRYLFLTKNPTRYHELALFNKLPASENYWYGSTITNTDDLFWHSGSHNTFISVEPILGNFTFGKDVPVDWVIIGAMTGPGSKEHQPTSETVFNIARATGPVFMKDSLIPIVGEENMRREFPWK